MSHRSIFYTRIAAVTVVALGVVLFAAASATKSDAATAPGLGAAASYAVLAGQSVTNTGPTTIEGDVGVSPGTAVSGFPPGMVTEGTIHSADAHAGAAQGSLTTAYNALSSEPCTDDLTGQDLGGQVLTEGVYCFSSSAQLTGLLTLDAGGSADAVFIFKIGSTLTTASNASVLVTNGGTDCNVFWRVGSSATIGVGTTFAGNILALTSITLNTGASVSGRALARNGSVTLDSNDVSFAACGTATPTVSPTASPVDTGEPTATAVPTTTTTLSPTPTGQTPSPTPVGQTPTASPTPTPVGQTPTATPTPTPVGQTPTATPTPALPTATPSPSATLVTHTPSPTPVLPTATPSPTPQAPTSPPGSQLPPPGGTTPASPRVPGFPNTGGPPAEGGVLWTPLLLGLILIGFGTTAFALSSRGKRCGADDRRF